MKKLLAILLTAVLLTASAAAVAEDFYAVSLGWAENASGQRQKTGFTESFENYGWTNYSIVDANYDPVAQTDQIRAFIAKQPKALFITPPTPPALPRWCARRVTPASPSTSPTASFPARTR